MRHPGRTPSRGFTLIEILVVIVIISISVGIVMVNFTGGGQAGLAKEEARRIQQLLRFAHQQAVIRAEEYGLRFYTQGYRFMRFDEDTQEWLPMQRDKLLTPRVLEAPLELELYIEEIEVNIPETFDDDPEPESTRNTSLNLDNPPVAEAEKIKPHIFLLSSTELTPAFELVVRIPGSDIHETVRGLPQGEYLYVEEE